MFPFKNRLKNKIGLVINQITNKHICHVHNNNSTYKMK